MFAGIPFDWAPDGMVVSSGLPEKKARRKNEKAPSSRIEVCYFADRRWKLWKKRYFWDFGWSLMWFSCLVWLYIDWAILLVVIRRARCVNIPCNINDLSCCQLFQSACFTWLCHVPNEGCGSLAYVPLSNGPCHWKHIEVPRGHAYRIILECVDAKIIITEVQFYCEAATLQAGTIPPDFILRVSNRGEKSSQGWVFDCVCIHHQRNQVTVDTRKHTFSPSMFFR